MGTAQTQKHCPTCAGPVMAQRKTPNHILHLLLSIVTVGIWLIVWFLALISSEPWICSKCGSKKVKNNPKYAGLNPDGTPMAKAIPADGDTISCPLCMETIKRGAIRCKHCQGDLSAEAASHASP